MIFLAAFLSDNDCMLLRIVKIWRQRTKQNTTTCGRYHTRSTNPTRTITINIKLWCQATADDENLSALHHLRGRSIVLVYPARCRMCRLLLPSLEVPVGLLKVIVLLVGCWLTAHITPGNAGLWGSRCRRKPDHQPSHRGSAEPALLLLFHVL